MNELIDNFDLRVAGDWKLIWKLQVPTKWRSTFGVQLEAFFRIIKTFAGVMFSALGNVWCVNQLRSEYDICFLHVIGPKLFGGWSGFGNKFNTLSQKLMDTGTVCFKYSMPFKMVLGNALLWWFGVCGRGGMRRFVRMSSNRFGFQSIVCCICCITGKKLSAQSCLLNHRFGLLSEEMKQFG